MSRVARKILAVRGTTLVLADRRLSPIDVRPAWIAEHEPEAGGYYLIDDDGHASYAAILPEDVPAPAATDSAAAIMAHPEDHFRYDWLEECLMVLNAKLDSLHASLETIAAKETPHGR